ncbi:Lytic transglycosylase catalytic [Desulfatibacillum aliphaticivorans]|uniref:Lytic transglycosylase catalytic n=1 Tax=Desulfatibacillum aliphaticivorans TaxID=218208 RepID=B8FGC6_DESAL|nr:lytic transglycosylase domain-containing protein [Desulfatibacillum aliphaticivorans]ACL03806.1 Lytic transglycosylase catalytic [Desulfatibacillum aliphaticivorans]
MKFKRSICAFCLFMVLGLLTGFAWASLRDPGLGEAAIHQHWKRFQKDPDRYAIETQYPYKAIFEKAAKQYDLPLNFLVAVCKGESDFDPKAGKHRSPDTGKECYGIGQIQWPGTANDMGIEKFDDLFIPEKNIFASARYLAWLKDRYDGSLYHTLCAYNYGPGAVKVGNVPDGAQWYAHYIWKNLNRLMDGEIRLPPSKLIIECTSYKLANALQENWLEIYHSSFPANKRSSIPEVKVVIRKSDWYTYQCLVVTKNKNPQNVFATFFDAIGITPIDS